jgi:hypothetical protein
MSTSPLLLGMFPVDKLTPLQARLVNATVAFSIDVHLKEGSLGSQNNRAWNDVSRCLLRMPDSHDHQYGTKLHTSIAVAHSFARENGCVIPESLVNAINMIQQQMLPKLNEFQKEMAKLAANISLTEDEVAMVRCSELIVNAMTWASDGTPQLSRRSMIELRQTYQDAIAKTSYRKNDEIDKYLATHSTDHLTTVYNGLIQKMRTAAAACPSNRYVSEIRLTGSRFMSTGLETRWKVPSTQSMWVFTN